MNDFFSLIGTLASIGSIPLSIYLYLKSREDKFDRIKREIVKILSHQIGDRRVLTTFEIQTVINSITREHRVDNQRITVNQIIEDIVAETISNPLLDKDVKEKIILELKNIYFKGEILDKIEEIEFKADKSSSVIIENELKDILEKNREIYTDELKIQKRRVSRLSEYFAIVASTTTLIATITLLLGKEKYEKVLTEPLYGFLKENDFYIGLIVSILTAIVSSLLLVLIKKKRDKN